MADLRLPLYRVALLLAAGALAAPFAVRRVARWRETWKGAQQLQSRLEGSGTASSAAEPRVGAAEPRVGAAEPRVGAAEPRVGAIEPATAPAGDPDARLRRKTEELDRAVRANQSRGVDVSAIVRSMEGFDALVKAGRVGEAEALIDAVLKQLPAPTRGSGAPARGGADGPPPGVAERHQRLMQLVQRRKEAGLDSSQVLNRLEPLPALVQAGRVREAEALLDEALSSIGDPSAGPQR